MRVVIYLRGRPECREVLGVTLGIWPLGAWGGSWKIAWRARRGLTWMEIPQGGMFAS